MNPSLVLTPNDLRPCALNLHEEVCALESYAPLHGFAVDLLGRGVLLSSHGMTASPEELGYDGPTTAYADYVLQHPVKFWEYCRVLDMLSQEQVENVLDIGGASSPFSFFLASLGHRVAIVDAEAVSSAPRSIVANANETASSMGWDLVAVHGTGTRLPYPDGTQDAVTSISVLELVGPPGEQAQVFREAHRVLRSGGMFAISFDYGRLRGIRGHHPVRDAAAISDLVSAAPFEVVGNTCWRDVDYSDDAIVVWEREHSRYSWRQLRRRRWYTAFTLFLRRP